MNKRLKDKKMLSGIIAAGGFLIILAGSALSQQTALGQNYQGVYVDGTFVGYVAENVDVKDVILQARRKLAEESASRLCMDYEWSVKTEKKPFVRLEKKETLEEQLKKILAILPWFSFMSTMVIFAGFMALSFKRENPKNFFLMFLP